MSVEAVKRKPAKSVEVRNEWDSDGPIELSVPRSVIQVEAQGKDPDQTCYPSHSSLNSKACNTHELINIARGQPRLGRTNLLAERGWVGCDKDVVCVPSQVLRQSAVDDDSSLPGRDGKVRVDALQGESSRRDVKLSLFIAG